MEPQRFSTILVSELLEEDDESVTLMPDDIFKFSVHVYYRPINPGTRIRGSLVHRSPSRCIPCHNFFQEGREFFRRMLWRVPLYVESPEDIIENLMSTIGERFLHVDAAASPSPPPPSSESPHREIPFELTILILDTFNLELHAALVEESMLSFKMIPASNEAIETLLKKSTVMTRSESPCSICLEDLEINDECGTMPCKHVFHSQCIVTWLQTSHMCALCRYPLPFKKDCD